MKIETKNDFLIGSMGNSISSILPIHIISREQAFRTAAWIALMGHTLPSENPGEPSVSFEEVKKAIEST